LRLSDQLCWRDAVDANPNVCAARAAR
jgi:hypothetical protein